MPSAARTLFVCQTCGTQTPKWQGKCANCNSWNSFVEEKIADFRGTREQGVKPLPLSQVALDAHPFPTLAEADRVLGGGLIPGSLLLVAGAPGIGKSTLLLQLAAEVAKEKPVLYVSGEESEFQTKRRAERLGLKASSLLILHEISLSAILDHLQALKPSTVIIDSIQTLYKEDLSSAPGSVAQVRECAGELLRQCKSLGTAILLVGHITKDGSIAGPRVLEHIVDTVLYLEGEGTQPYRMLRALKNRFGSTQEVGIFEMTSKGFLQVTNPSGLFLQSRGSAPGSVVVPILEGRRPLLMELQALVSHAYGIPKRLATGVDFNRINIILAILEKHCRLPLSRCDVYMNVAGAMKIREPAADLPMAMAVASSMKEQPIPLDWIVFGELGLGGEVRAVSLYEERIREACQIGFKRAIVPKANHSEERKIQVTGVSTLQEAVALLLSQE